MTIIRIEYVVPAFARACYGEFEFCFFFFEIRGNPSPGIVEIRNSSFRQKKKHAVAIPFMLLIYSYN